MGEQQETINNDKDPNGNYGAEKHNNETENQLDGFNSNPINSNVRKSLRHLLSHLTVKV
jgi:hypothetical protein